MAAYCLQGAVYQGVPCLPINNLLMLQQVFTFLINNNQQSDLKEIQNENKTCNEDAIPGRHAVKMTRSEDDIYAACLTLPHLCHCSLTAAVMPQHLQVMPLLLCHSTEADTLMQQQLWHHIHSDTASFTQQHCYCCIAAALTQEHFFATLTQQH